MPATFIIQELPADSTVGFGPRGGAKSLWRYKGHECILAGPAETGKTFSCLHKLDALLWKYPGSQAVMLRKTLASLHTSVLRSYRMVIGHPDTPIKFYGGDKPEWADYPNGSRVFFAGIDNPQKALSSERDFVYVNQAEELRLEDWEILTTRCTGRAGNAPYAQIFGDCNPGPPTHWILHRPSLKVFESRHEDNPVLFDDDGRLTEQGGKTLAILDRLTGVRKERLRYGRWVQAEGVVYEEWDRARHIVDAQSFASVYFRRHVAGVDWGYTNPGVIVVFGIDGDGRMTLVREVYRAREGIGWWVAQAQAIRDAYHVETFVCDPSEPGFIEEFRRARLPVIQGVNDIRPGIQAVAARLAGDGADRPRLLISSMALTERDEDLGNRRLPTCSVEEFESYMWPKGQDGKAVKEIPLDANNHALDAIRYATCYVDGLNRSGAQIGRSPLAGFRGC